jgi:hypothetical protein
MREFAEKEITRLVLRDPEGYLAEQGAVGCEVDYWSTLAFNISGI